MYIAPGLTLELVLLFLGDGFAGGFPLGSTMNSDTCCAGTGSKAASEVSGWKEINEVIVL